MSKTRYGSNAVIKWQDKKRIMGMPITFTRYKLVETEDWLKLFVNVGFLSSREDEINLYRIYDITVTRSLADKIFGVGTITLYSKDESNPTMSLMHIKNPYDVRNLLTKLVEEEKLKRGFRVAEFN